MSLDAQRLYELLPAVYRVRDAEQGGPLRALMALFADELQAIEADIEQLYDDQFIETCADWVAPYIGDLIGYRPVHGASPAVASPRAEVANTIAYRRRKGTALMLEQLARDLTGWPAHAAECFEQLATTQYMKHPRLHAPATAAVRSEAAMRRVGSAFNTSAHTAEVRRPQTGAGRFNIPNVALFVWRLQAQRLSAQRLVADPGDASGRRWRFNPLGADAPLFRQPQPDELDSLSTPAQVPEPLGVRAMAADVRAARSGNPAAATAADYGAGQSVLLQRHDGMDWQDVPLTQITLCDLRDVPGGWAHEADLPADQIGLDPERGRLLLGADISGPLRMHAHLGFARDIGGGEYQREPYALQDTSAPEHLAGEDTALQPLLDSLSTTGGRLLLTGSHTITETLSLHLDGHSNPGEAGLELVIAAANGARPVLRLAGELLLDLGPRARLVLDGLVIEGGPLRLAASADAEPRELLLRHCTLVPGRSLSPLGQPVSPGAASLVVAHPFARVELRACISGALQLDGSAEAALDDCILDANAPEAIAYAAPDGGPGATLELRGCTVIGKVRAQVLQSVSNSLLHARLASGDAWPAPVWAARTQQGCVRFSWLPAQAIAPRRHRCLPSAEQPHCRPQFNAPRYGHPAYAQLSARTDTALRHGADDGGEIGVMHPLAQPLREANLALRLDEYLRFGLQAGLFPVT